MIAMNKTIFQFFHWYYSSEGILWNHCRNEVGRLASLGVTDVWLPPAYKSAKGVDEPGYAVYDLYDLGEFDQKGTVRTKYGTKDEYINCISSLKDSNISIIADIVLNHKHGGDEKERIPIIRVKNDDRRECISGREEAEVFTRFTFPGRKGKYSKYVWDWHSFTGICEDGCIGIIMNEYSKNGWEKMLEEENGNFDYLMGNDIEFRNPCVREELKRWGEWYVKTTGIDGFRLDALKHIYPGFFPEWLDHLQTVFKRQFFCIGEYWQNSVQPLIKYTDVTGGKIQLFDVPLHYNFHYASMEGERYDLRTIFDNTLIQQKPELAISFVENHDTQPLQSLQSPIDQWFKPLAYALILLREQGIPCVFFPALYGCRYADKSSEGEEICVQLNNVTEVELLMKVRKTLAYGVQRDYFDDPNIIGWSRQGTDRTGCAVLISNGKAGSKLMSMGEVNAGKTMIDLCGNIEDQVTLNENGEGVFQVKSRSISVWIDRNVKSL
jgi:alpha-amylase